MAVVTASGTRIFIGPAVTEADADTIAEFRDLSPYTEITEVENYGEYGDESPLVNFVSVGDGRVRKTKGARDAGTMTLVVGRDPLDAGQNLLVAAEQTKFEYAFKIVHADAPTEDYSNSEDYFRAIVSSRRANIGENDNVVRRTFNLAINSEVFESPAAELT